MARKFGVWAGVAGVLAVGAGASAGVTAMDFEGLQHGEIVTGQIGGVTISAENPNRPVDLAIIFDSNRTGTADFDLEGPDWDMGNLSPSTNLGNLLILAETYEDNNGDGLIDSPNDEGNRPAGSIFMDFDNRQQFLGFDIVDLETFIENGSLRFFLAGGLVGEVQFDDFINPASPFYDPSVAFGNNSANRISPIGIAQLGGTAFDRVEFRFGGSGALDNITLVPAPGAAALAAMGLVLGGRRRRR